MPNRSDPETDPEADPEAILLFDAGNTRIKWGLHRNGAWQRRGAVLTAQAGHLAHDLGAAAQIGQAIASNVAGPAVQEVLESVARGWGRQLRTVRSLPEQLGVSNGYAQPEQLGTDRWAALIGAHRAAPGHKLVAMAGTALTIDALRADGRFLGGVIVPGPAMMRGSLDRGTAGLRLTDGAFDMFPRSTPDAITTGALVAASGAILRMAEAMASRGCPPATLLLSGGGAGEIAPHLPTAAVIHENLVLDGLALIARET